MRRPPQTGITLPQEDDAIAIYLHEISQRHLLSPAEEVHLAQQIEAGRVEKQKPAADRNAQVIATGLQAHRVFVEANLRLVVSQARLYFVSSSMTLDFLDLCQEGTIGLLHAIDHFEWRRGYKFSTYAVWWIRQALGRACDMQGRLVKLPIHVSQKLYRIKRAQYQLLEEFGVPPSAEKIAALLALPRNTVSNILSWEYQCISLEQVLNNSHDQQPDELVEECDPQDMLDQIIGNPTLERLREALEHAGLTSREREIIDWRFGFRDQYEYSCTEIGKKLIPALSRERVRQLEHSALEKLRVFLCASSDAVASSTVPQKEAVLLSSAT